MKFFTDVSNHNGKVADSTDKDIISWNEGPAH